MLQQSKTASQIQKAAETLFAEQGFAETTMRQITSEANVNLAAVNYHFGSKQGLIKAIAEQYLSPLTLFIEDAVATRLMVSSHLSVQIEELIEILMRGLLSVHNGNPHALSMFTRLLDLAYMKDQQPLREYFLESHQEKLKEFIELLRKDSAPMEDDEFFWRLHFLLGAMVFTFSNFNTLRAMGSEEFDIQVEVESVLHRMIPVLSAGLQARSDKTYLCRL